MGTGLELAVLGSMAASEFAGMARQRKLAKAEHAAGIAQMARDKQTFEANQRRRKEALKKSLAKMRAQMGARGLSASSGSSAALLSGLTQEAEQEAREERSLFQQGLGVARRNLLAHRYRQPTGVENIARGLQSLSKVQTRSTDLLQEKGWLGGPAPAKEPPIGLYFNRSGSR